MHRKLWAATVLAGLGAATILVLLVIAAATQSAILSFATGVAGLVLIVAACIVVRRALDQVLARTNRLSTRLQKLEALHHDVVVLGTERNATKVQLAGIHRQLKVLRNRVPAGYLDPVEAEIRDHKIRAQALLRTTFESAIQLKRNPRSLLTESQAEGLFQDYLQRDELLQLSPLIEHFDLLRQQRLSTLRRLFRFYRNSGYWDFASLVIEALSEKSGLDTDANAAAKLNHEIEVFALPDQVVVELQDGAAYDPSGPILHLVGRVLPETQTGYTLRTQYTAEAQAAKGLPVAIVGQSGITGRAIDNTDHYKFQGIDYYLLPGPVRNHVLLDDWLRQNMKQLAVLVRDIRPSILHAQSDFFNALIVSAVGKKYGIPTVYESRGFWEDSWLSRTVTANDWHDSGSLFSTYGLPSAYGYRKTAEGIARLLPDHVFTLAEVMRDHILSAARGALDGESVTIVPNAVKTENFPVQERDDTLAAELGLPKDTVTIGYISSMVEYEGIDTLIDAYQLASVNSPNPMCLLLVGDGDYLPKLKERVEKKGIPHVYFTGRVPHEDVLRYYGLIDLFVVPRKPSTVADLVTPLKPFEAFATGRTVVLSDVGALREIAEDSDAVELFHAGDAKDLANKIVELLEAPEQRLELSTRASAWVRNHRTWDGNVAEYFRIYKKLGYTGSSTMALEAELHLYERAINAGDLIDAFALLEEPPLTGWFSNSLMKQTAQEILDVGWKYEEFEPVPVASQPDWASYGEIDRSWGYNLHTWKFLEPLLREYSTSHEIFWLEKAVDIALDWISTYRRAEASLDLMVWYDMALALRVPILLNLVTHVTKVHEMRAEATVLVECLIWHAEKLEEDVAFNPNNNHGFYTAASQLHLSKFGSPIPGATEIQAQGRQRLETMVDRQFATDGVHLEHSPDYHRMLLASFERAIQDDLIIDDDIRERIQKASRVLGWMIQPDGRLVQFGDSPSTLMLMKNATSIDPQTQFIMTDGKKGSPPSTQMAVFKEGGYAFVRSPIPEGPGDLGASGYLAMNAAFHSRAHKHADDLSIVWYDKGTEILVDAGRFGYGELLPQDSALRKQGFYYSAAERQYVEGTTAHNTLMIDGEDQERRLRAPYGSGIGECTEKSGVFDLAARVRHPDYLHRRRLVYTPGSTLLIKDSVFSQSPESRAATIWLNIDGNFELIEIGETVIFERHVNGEAVRLEVEGPGELVRPVRGQEEPLRGWRSRQDRKLEPVWSVGFAFPVDTRLSVETVLRIT